MIAELKKDLIQVIKIKHGKRSGIFKNKFWLMNVN
jgi:hypothetical protein